MSFHISTHVLGATPLWLAEQSINMWAVAHRSWSIEKLHLKIIAGRAVQGAEHKSNGFFLQMCEDEAQGTVVFSSGPEQHIFAKKTNSICRWVSSAAAEPRGLSGCFHHRGGRQEGTGGREASAAKTPGCLINSTV